MQTTQTSQAAGSRGWKLLGLMPLLLAVGCQNSAGTGALVGGGAVLVGNAVAKATGGSRTAGTMIGGALGAVTGAVVGDNHDRAKSDAEARGRASALAQQNSMRAPTLQDIATLSKTGTPDNIIINQIQTTNATYPNLSTQDLFYLRENMVSSTVIQVMQGTSVPQGAVYSRQPVTLVEPVYPRPAVGASFSYTNRR